MGILALIGLGSNLGDRKATLDAAVAALSEGLGTTVRAVSPYHETVPVGGPEGQGAYLNGAAAVETVLPPEELLRLLHRIESRSGRVRSVRWGERTLDLDLLLFGDVVIGSTPVFNRVFGGLSVPLRVPHPRMALRRFVLTPLAEIAPEAVDPVTGRTVADLLANLDRRPSYVAIHAPQPCANDLYRALLAFLPALGSTHEAERELLRKQILAIGWPDGGAADPSRRMDWVRDRCRLLLETLFERQCHDLDVARSRGGIEENFWVVSDSWLDADYWIAKSLDDGPSAFLERLLEARSRVLAPTFVVVPNGCRMSLSRFEDRWPSPLGDVPTLEIRPEAPAEDIAEEVLATCRATRPV